MSLNMLLNLILKILFMTCWTINFKVILLLLIILVSWIILRLRSFSQLTSKNWSKIKKLSFIWCWRCYHLSIWYICDISRFSYDLSLMTVIWSNKLRILRLIMNLSLLNIWRNMLWLVGLNILNLSLIRITWLC